jgi:DNA-directed RNA polymerase specialized sigma24 family protein
MRAEEQFDSFYLKTRRDLVHQTFALTGDLAAAQGAVRDTYVAAWHHWHKVKAHEDPRDWVRPRAWALAQRRHTARLWQRTRDLSAEDRAVLDAIHKLPGAERRALLVAQLAGVPLEVGARELNVTQAMLERQLQSASAGIAVTLDIDPATVRGRLLDLGGAAQRATLPRPSAVRRAGRTRRRTHTVVAAAVATFLAVGTGAFAHQPSAETPEAGPLLTDPRPAEPTGPAASPEPATEPSPTPESTLPSADDLLMTRHVGRLDPRGTWRVLGTHDNTSGEGINYVCQQERFADPDGLATLVRALRTKGRPAHTVTQVVEISDTPEASAETYATVLSWLAACEGGDLHLKQVYDVSGVADSAKLLEFTSWTRPRMAYSAAVAQVGQVVTTTVVRTVVPQRPGAYKVARTLAAASRMICARAGETSCPDRPRLEAVAPPRSAEPAGVLATLDLPPLRDVARPWVGTRPVPAPRNPAATSCDRARFRRMGAAVTRTRTFLVPEARLPDRFGLTETYGRFPSKKAAAAFLRTVRQRFASCEDRDLATRVLVPRPLRHGPLNGSTWRLRTELSESRKVVYDVGFVRRGNVVAQLTFVPAEQADLRRGAFRALVVRAGQRLGELD